MSNPAVDVRLLQAIDVNNDQDDDDDDEEFGELSEVETDEGSRTDFQLISSHEVIVFEYRNPLGGSNGNSSATADNQ